jgi:uncharacterized membrane protein
MSTFHPTNLLDKIFEGGIVLKGVSGALEFLGGLGLLFINPDKLHHFINFVAQPELVQDNHNKIAAWLMHTSQHFTTSSKAFLIGYLWIHAAVKLIAVIGIIKNQLWAYPFALITLGLLMLYQLYDIFFVHASLGMIALTIFDAFIVALIWREYGKVKQTLGKASPPKTAKENESSSS